jgi:hypothetical protein
MDDLNSADLTTLQPHFDPARVKAGLREKVLDDASGLFPCGLVLFEDNRNVCSTRHITAVPPIHETYPLKTSIQLHNPIIDYRPLRERFPKRTQRWVPTHLLERRS